MTRFIFALSVVASLAMTLAAQSAPYETLADGVVRHTPSGFLFPPRVGPFQREDPPLHLYDKAGLDVSAAYDSGRAVAATVYVYPAPNETSSEVLDREYLSKKGEVMQAHRDATVLSEDSVTVTQGGVKQSGRKAFFTFRDSFRGARQDLKSLLLVFQLGQNFIEYRFTYPLDQAEKAEKDIYQFILDWSWR